MPKSSEISLRRAAVGLLSAAKKRSRCVSCSGVTRDLLRFSRGSPDLDFEVEAVAGADLDSVEPSPAPSSFDGDCGGASVAAERGVSPGVPGDIDALGEDAVDSVTRDISSPSPYLDEGSRSRWGILARLRSPELVSDGNNGSLAIGCK